MAVQILHHLLQNFTCYSNFVPKTSKISSKQMLVGEIDFRVNFINIFRKAFTSKAPKDANNLTEFLRFYDLSTSKLCVNMLVKFTSREAEKDAYLFQTLRIKTN